MRSQIQTTRHSNKKRRASDLSGLINDQSRPKLRSIGLDNINVFRKDLPRTQNTKVVVKDTNTSTSSKYNYKEEITEDNHINICPLSVAMNNLTIVPKVATIKYRYRGKKLLKHCTIVPVLPPTKSAPHFVFTQTKENERLCPSAPIVKKRRRSSLSTLRQDNSPSTATMHDDDMLDCDDEEIDICDDISINSYNETEYSSDGEKFLLSSLDFDKEDNMTYEEEDIIKIEF